MMTYTSSIRLVTLLAGLLALLPATATYSGLMLIPTADLVAPCEYAVTAVLEGGMPGHRVDTYLLYTTVGLTDRLEAGLNYDFSSGMAARLSLDAKYRLPVPAAAGLPQAAVGIYDVARHTQASPYVVVSHDLTLARLHAGVARIDRNTQAFFGLDRAVTDRWTLMADYTTGADNFATVGLYTDLSDRVNLLAGAYFPNAGGETLFTLQLGFCGSFGTRE